MDLSALPCDAHRVAKHGAIHGFEGEVVTFDLCLEQSFATSAMGAARRVLHDFDDLGQRHCVEERVGALEVSDETVLDAVVALGRAMFPFLRSQTLRPRGAAGNNVKEGALAFEIRSSPVGSFRRRRRSTDHGPPSSGGPTEMVEQSASVQRSFSAAASLFGSAPSATPRSSFKSLMARSHPR